MGELTLQALHFCGALLLGDQVVVAAGEAVRSVTDDEQQCITTTRSRLRPAAH